jgi:biopolymer transport protein ExbB
VTCAAASASHIAPCASSPPDRNECFITFEEEHVELQSRLTGFALLGAEWVMWLLIALSIIAVGIILERAAYFIFSRDDVPALAERIVELLGKGDHTGALRRLEESPSVEARIAVAGLSGLPAGAEGRMKTATHLSRLRMEHNLAFLGTLGNNAPFVGLLGTVIGIIAAFHELDATGGRASAGLMSEIGEALVVTGLGLVVALPAVAGFNLYQRLIQIRLERAEALALTVLGALESPNSSRSRGRGEA